MGLLFFYALEAATKPRNDPLSSCFGVASREEDTDE